MVLQVAQDAPIRWRTSQRAEWSVRSTCADSTRCCPVVSVSSSHAPSGAADTIVTGSGDALRMVSLMVPAPHSYSMRSSADAGDSASATVQPLDWRSRVAEDTVSRLATGKSSECIGGSFRPLYSKNMRCFFFQHTRFLQHPSDFLGTLTKTRGCSRILVQTNPSWIVGRVSCDRRKTHSLLDCVFFACHNPTIRFPCFLTSKYYIS
jgi:hypothetical protein